MLRRALETVGSIDDEARHGDLRREIEAQLEALATGGGTGDGHR